MLKAPTILGISPGTRNVGIVIWRGDRLSEWQIKTFKGSWTEGKLKNMLFSIERVLNVQEVTAIAIKLPEPSHSSPSLQMLVSEIQILARRRKLKVKTYTLTELKRFCSKERKFTKSQMIRFIAEKNPVLHFEYNKEMKNKNPYYTKMFEAIIAVMLCHKEDLDNHSIPSPYSFYLL